MPAKSVRANLKFLADLEGELVYIPSKGGGDETAHVGNFTHEQVDILDAREAFSSTDLDAEGFRLVAQPTTVTDFFDDDQIRSVYESEVVDLIKEQTGASRVEIFDHTRRSSSLEQQQQWQIREPADIVHNDYTAASGIKRLRDYFADKSEDVKELLNGRFAIINVWRSMAGPVLDHPLAFCDGTTVKPDHLVPVERRAKERIGELQTALYDAAQRWYYYPELQMDEALLIKTFDSESSGVTRFTIHTSFKDPRAGTDIPPRQSLETRSLVFF